MGREIDFGCGIVDVIRGAGMWDKFGMGRQDLGCGTQILRYGAILNGSDVEFILSCIALAML